MNNACILSIGDELTSGLTLNTNCSWLSEQVATLGIRTVAHVTVGDDLAAIVQAIKESAASAEILLVSGGLGPTEDDLTRQALAEALGETLVQDDAALAHLHAWFEKRGRLMSASNLVQALRPASATCLANPVGTARGLCAKLGNCTIFVMPGVPVEMKQMFTASVLPQLQTVARDRVTIQAKLNTYGMGESVIGERIKDLMVRGGNPLVGTSVHEGIVSVRIYATGLRADAQGMIDQAKGELRRRLGELIFSENDISLGETVGGLLLAKKQAIATAESCTGGLLAKILTDMPGSSGYFMRGWVTYSNQAKVDEVGVSAELIAQHGAVSEQVALAMADGARVAGKTQWGVGITGIAGPGGGSEDKPVGLVWIAVAGGDGNAARRTVFAGDREGIRLRAAHLALALLRWRLMGINADALLMPATTAPKDR